MKLENLLPEYAQKLGMGKIVPEADGIVTLRFNDEHLVTLEPSLDGEGFYIYSVVGSMPEMEEELARELLGSNLFGKETGHASLGYEPTVGALLLFQFFHHETTDLTAFEKELEKFLGYLAHWKGRLS